MTRRSQRQRMCQRKVNHTQTNAVTEANRLGYPAVPYICQLGYMHWHVGRNPDSDYHIKDGDWTSRAWYIRREMNKISRHRGYHAASR